MKIFIILFVFFNSLNFSYTVNANDVEVISLFDLMRDYTIVNPAKLSSSLQFAIKFNCCDEIIIMNN